MVMTSSLCVCKCFSIQSNSLLKGMNRACIYSYAHTIALLLARRIALFPGSCVGAEHKSVGMRSRGGMTCITIGEGIGMGKVGGRGRGEGGREEGERGGKGEGGRGREEG